MEKQNDQRENSEVRCHVSRDLGWQHSTTCVVEGIFKDNFLQQDNRTLLLMSTNGALIKKKEFNHPKKLFFFVFFLMLVIWE